MSVATENDGQWDPKWDGYDSDDDINIWDEAVNDEQRLAICELYKCFIDKDPESLQHKMAMPLLQLLTDSVQRSVESEAAEKEEEKRRAEEYLRKEKQPRTISRPAAFGFGARHVVNKPKLDDNTAFPTLVRAQEIRQAKKKTP
jgi:hypothetical protein